MNKRLRRKSVAVLAVAALAAGMFAALGPVPGGASSHREAPIISRDPGVDNTDLYVFNSPDRPEFVTLISNWWPFEEPAGGPNFFAFDPNARYDFNISNDGDPAAEIIYRFTFTNHYNSTNTFLYNTGQVTSLSDPNLNFFQRFDLQRIVVGGNTTTLLDNRRVVPNRVGNASMPDYVDDLYMPGRHQFGNTTPKSQALAGQSDDPFFADLRVFDLLYGANFSEVGDDTLAGFNTQVLALQVRKSSVRQSGAQPIIGVWATASRRATRVQNTNGSQSFSGNFRQVSRLGMPLVNEVVVPVGDKDKWNSSNPANDGQFLSYVTDPELPELIEAIYAVPAPSTPRNDLVDIFLRGLAGLNRPPGVVASEMLRLNTSTPTCEPPGCGAYSRLGVIDGDNSGYPNGRRLADDAIDISLDVMEDLPAGSLSDAVDLNDVPFLTQFPYVAAPHSGSDPMPH
ncbi:MAG: DUF4331 domain-containing protein [Actinomycetota bacterium]